MIALKGLPTVDEVPLSNAILEALLDLLDGQSERRSVPAVDARPSLNNSVIDALRRLSAFTPERRTEPPEADASAEPTMPEIDRVPPHDPAPRHQANRYDALRTELSRCHEAAASPPQRPLGSGHCAAHGT
jgi:hypothetical protein